MKRKFIIAATAAINIASLSHAATGDQNSLIAAEDGRLHAEMTHDATALAASLADELQYTHANGKKQTKSDYLAAQGNSHGAPVESITNRTALVGGDLGVTRGDLHIAMGALHLESSYLAVYVWRDARWQLLDWQTSPAPGDPLLGPGKH